MPTKWCIIHDLSWPTAHSVNGSIPKEQSSCTYDTPDRTISQLKLHGQGALMSKLDLSDAFRHILVCQEDWELLGSTWQIDINGTLTPAYVVNALLLFGLCSSPALFLKYMDMLSFNILDCGASPVWKYLDDFWTCDPLPNELRYHAQYLCRSWLQFLQRLLCHVLPWNCWVSNSIVIPKGQAFHRLVLTRLYLLRTWQTKVSCSKRQLQSLIGKLNFICMVCRSGRTFFRRMIE